MIPHLDAWLILAAILLFLRGHPFWALTLTLWAAALPIRII